MKLTFLGVDGIPMVEPGDDLASMIHDAALAMGEPLRNDDVVVIAQKIISKAENRYLDLSTVTPSAEAEALAVEVDKDPRKVRAILDESNEVVRARPGVLIVEQRQGFVQANAGIDQSNIAWGEVAEDDLCLLLPEWVAKAQSTLVRLTCLQVTLKQLQAEKLPLLSTSRSAFAPPRMPVLPSCLSG